jgi:hypothetical protein
MSALPAEVTRVVVGAALLWPQTTNSSLDCKTIK